MNRRSFLGLLSALPVIGRLAASTPVAAVAAPVATAVAPTAALASGCIIGIALETISKGEWEKIAISATADNDLDPAVFHAIAARHVQAGDFLYASDIGDHVRDFRAVRPYNLANYDG